MCAIKTIEKSIVLAKPEYLDFLAKEITALRCVDHRYIIRMRGAYEDETRIYIVTDLLTDGDLLNYVVANGKVSEEHSAHYIRSLLMALEYLHLHNLVHRDVKLENILITKNSSNEPRGILTDLGLVCYSDKPDTGLSDSIGSIGYAAPEVFRGSYGYK
jgi:serine/threonine protein kinase